jgi:hypothetical protein
MPKVGQATVEAVEAFADGTTTTAQLAEAQEAIRRFSGSGVSYGFCSPALKASDSNGSCTLTISPQPLLGLLHCITHTETEPLDEQRLPTEFVIHTVFLRDIFGNPFRPVTFSPSWRTDTVVSLARQMYESRDFFAMLILADALQDAGCDSDDVLNHCRDANQVHVRGCWVVDLVLGEE